MMRLVRQLARGLRALTNRRLTDADLDEEVRDYFERTVDAYRARGLSDAEARRAAHVELGNVTVVREQVRDYGWENIVESTAADLRIALRRLRLQPAFTAVTVATLALGIGASTAIFSAVNPILFRALPYPSADRVVSIWDITREGLPLSVTFGTQREIATRSTSLDAVATMKSWQPSTTGGSEPERFEGQRVSADFFRVLGVAPAVGRSFTSDEDRPGGPDVVILSDAVWRRRFGGDPAIVGRTISLNDRPFTVVGVMPASFVNVVAPAATVWAPLQYDPSLPIDGREWGHHLRMIGRLRAGVSVDDASRELATIARAPIAEFPRVRWASLENGLRLVPLRDDVTQHVRPAMLAVAAAVALVLVIACVNVTNLLLGRGAQRRAEIAMRAALGAGRGRILRQLVTESVVLAFAGGMLGLLLAVGGIRALVAVSPAELPRVEAIRVDGVVLVFALVLTTVVGVLVGLVPAFQASRADGLGSLTRQSRRTAGGHRTTRGVLVVVEVALALTLLVSAGLLMRSLQRLFAIAPGFDRSQVVAMQVLAASGRYSDSAATHQFYESVLAAVRRVPGVRAASFTSQLPLSGESEMYGVLFEADAGRSDRGRPALRYAVTPGYLETMRIPLERGRSLQVDDVRSGPVPVLINASLARQQFGDRNPVGQRLRIGDQTEWYTIVGVVGDVKQTSLASDANEAVYLPSRRWPDHDRAMWLVVRTDGDLSALTSALRAAVWSVDKDQPIARVTTMEHLVTATASDRRFAFVVFEAFGLVALTLATIGIYGVLSAGVTERLREIGVRSALGASPGDLVALVLRQGLTLTTLGVIAGLLIAGGASRGLGSLLFEIAPLDVVTYVGVVVVLVVVSLIACAVPAWRAARVDPATTLRAD